MQNNLAYFYPIGGGLTDLQKSGQDKRFVNGEYPYYLDEFENVYLFDYSNQEYKTNNNKIIQIINRHKLDRFIYAIFLPMIERKTLRTCRLIRVSHLLGMPPAIIAKLMFRLPIVFNYGYDYEGFARMEKKKIHAWIFKILKTISIKMADGVICTNKKIFDEMENHGGRAIYIPNRVDITLFKPIHLPSAQKDEFTILFVGRLTVQKNLFNLIKAICSLHNAKIKLIMIGRGSEEKKLREYAANCNVRLEIINHAANDKLPNYYNRANIFILPSIKEGSPKVLLEAMACGCCCLVSDIAENIEVVQDGINGFVCKTDDESIAEKISMIMSANNTSSIKQAARQTIVSKYSFEQLMKKEVWYLKKYRNIYEADVD